MRKLVTLMMVFAAIICGVSAHAQTTQLATLQHEESVEIFYGASALKSAHEAASDGDVITLSAGQFDAVDLTKQVSVRGAGMGLKEVPDYEIPSIIRGDFKATNVNFEGIRCEHTITLGGTVSIEKCYMSGVKSGTSVKVINSYINNFQPNSAIVTAVNSVFTAANTSTFNTNYRGVYNNCVLFIYNATTGRQSINRSTFINCIVTANKNSKGYFTLDSNSSAAYNCYFYGNSDGKSFEPTANDTNVENFEITTMFKDDTFYELKDEFKGFKTTDGKEVGIYGGNLPFTALTNLPKITRFQVSPKTSADGKLSVDIEVSGIE